MKIIRKKEFITRQWSGGSSTELYIFPHTSNYSDRNFDFRFSTAIIEQAESEFTSLPGVERILMLLEGKLIIRHAAHYEKELFPFDSDQFSGSWNTSSVGTGRDLNLMLCNGASGSIRAIEIPTGERWELQSEPSWNSHDLFWLYKGKLDHPDG
ncbi:MAG TPA: HutD family protein, partial [Flavobacteriales bacterium]|nr:HutD family protein [Flavobacteriales bacterium]